MQPQKIAIVSFTLTAAFVTAVGAASGPTAPRAARERIERGRYLVETSGCHDCHSPKIDARMTPDPKRPLSGRPQTTAPPLQGVGDIRASLDLTAWAGPWGNSFAANLTPDAETGLGSRYTEASFVRTIRTGKKPEGEELAPPMPWPAFAKMTDEDLKSIYAYLKTLTPVRNFVRASAPLTTRR
jgi:mono/diheme cytochrome c family protein